MSLGSSFAKYSILVTVTYLLSWVPSFLISDERIRSTLGQWNWHWPVFLAVGSIVGVRVLLNDRPLKFFYRSQLAAILFVTFSTVVLLYGVYVVRVPVVVLTSAAVINTFFFQLVVSIIEEVLYRGVAFEYLAPLENKLHKNKAARKWVPYSLFFTSVLFGLGHGVSPLLAGKGYFDWMWFLGTFAGGTALGAIYLSTRSVLLAGFAHFFWNTAGIFVIPAAKIIKDLSEVGFIRFH